MARPRKGEEKNATTQVGVRVTAELRARLDALAKRHSRSITDEVRAAIEAHVGMAAGEDGGNRRRRKARER